MSATVMELAVWQAYCSDCSWFGTETEEQARAEVEADEHDAANHGDES